VSIGVTHGNAGILAIPAILAQMYAFNINPRPLSAIEISDNPRGDLEEQNRQLHDRAEQHQLEGLKLDFGNKAKKEQAPEASSARSTQNAGRKENAGWGQGGQLRRLRARRLAFYKSPVTNAGPSGGSPAFVSFLAESLPDRCYAGPRMNSCARHSGRASSSMAKTKL